MEELNNSIDFVITWVDGNDPVWQEDKKNYFNGDERNNSSSRYRDWDFLRFWFRGIEKNAPWVRKIHFLTYGHVPEWLNINNPKLNIVTHDQFIPSKYLPTFSSHPIELNMHLIKDLSNKFVYFNDDVFIVSKVCEQDFFSKDLPCDEATLDYITSTDNDVFPHILLNSIDLINKNFNKRKVISKNFSKWYNIKNGRDSIIKNILLSWTTFFPGIKWRHICQPYLKHSFIELWEKENFILDKTCMNKFRDYKDVNPYVFRYWQLMKGNFTPKNLKKFGNVYHLPNNTSSLLSCMKKQSYKIICINDTEKCGEKEFENIQPEIKFAFQNLFPNPSSFEL